MFITCKILHWTKISHCGIFENILLWIFFQNENIANSIYLFDVKYIWLIVIYQNYSMNCPRISGNDNDKTIMSIHEYKIDKSIEEYWIIIISPVNRFWFVYENVFKNTSVHKCFMNLLIDFKWKKNKEV